MELLNVKGITKVNFSMTNKPLPSYYISSIPKGLYLVSVREYLKPRSIGESNGFKFYEESFSYLKAAFNINDSNIDETKFIFRIVTMFSTLHKLNGKPTNAKNVLLILNHIKEFSNYVFDVRELYFIVRSFYYNPNLVKNKKRDYIITEYKVYNEKIDFLNAMNAARKIVNSEFNLKELFYLLEERINNNDYGYIVGTKVFGQKYNNLLIYTMIRKFNMLCTGLKRKPRKQVKSNPLYNIGIKRITLKSLSLKPQQQNAFLKKQTLKCQKDLKAFNRLINNRKIAQQMFLILKDITGLETELKIIPEEDIQRRLKSYFINEIYKRISIDIMAEEKEFNSIYIKPSNKIVSINNNQSDSFDTDMSKSIFNQVTIEEALTKGIEFYYEYLKFHNISEGNEYMNFGIPLQ